MYLPGVAESGTQSSDSEPESGKYSNLDNLEDRSYLCNENSNKIPNDESVVRSSIRSRRCPEQSGIVNDEELDKAIKEDNGFTFLDNYNPRNHVDPWVSVQAILASRPLKSALSIGRSGSFSKVKESLESDRPASNQNKEVDQGTDENDSENTVIKDPNAAKRDSRKRGSNDFALTRREYFVKYVDQSQWHNAWMPGKLLLALHPNLIRTYARLHEKVFSSNGPSDSITFAYPETKNPHQNSDIEESDGALHTSDESNDENECLDKYLLTKDVYTALALYNKSSSSTQWSFPHRSKAAKRFNYLVHWGVDPESLIPERILDISDEFVPDQFEARHGCLDIDKVLNEAKTSSDTIVPHHEILVQWSQLGISQATWETVEVDSAYLEALPRTRFVDCLDPCGRRLLPRTLRRRLINLTHLFCVQRAVMLCDALGTCGKSRKDLHAQGASKPRKEKNWRDVWHGDEQPKYIAGGSSARLHPYQTEGVRWLWQAYHKRTGVILGDEMGLGKTVQVIVLFYSLWKELGDIGPFLVVAPLSTLENWEREFQLWAPQLRVEVYSGDKLTRATIREYMLRMPNNSPNYPAAFHVLLTSYELASKEYNLIRFGFTWRALVIDEAHRLKNKHTRVFRELSGLEAHFKCLLTGTPLQNNLVELFHLLNFLHPEKFADFKHFTLALNGANREERLKHLHEMLKDHLLRRMKADVVRDLPEKTEILLPVDMTLLQKRLYKMVLTKNYEELRSGSLMNTLVHLQKVCNHPYLMPAGAAIAPRLSLPESDRSSGHLPPFKPDILINVSGKLELMMRLLEGLKAGGHRVLIFSKMTSLLDLLEEALIFAKYNYERIDGSVKGPLRQVAIDRFNHPDSKSFIFLISTRAGGEGINLASADTVVLYDSDWNPHHDVQALSRAHRIGQSKPVVIYRFVTRHSLEERILKVARRKLALTRLVVNQQSQQTTKMRLSLREANELLRAGLDLLFDPAEEAVEMAGGIGSAKDELTAALPKPNEPSASREKADEKVSSDVTSEACSISLPLYTPSLQADIDPDVSSNLSAKAYFSSPVSKIDKSHKPIIYRPEDIARLLDRSRMTWESTDRPPGLLDDENNGSSATTAMASSGVLAESAETTSVYDFFAGTFKVAHFDDVPSANAVDRVCGTLAKQSEADEEETGAQEGREDGDTEECKQLAENVDKSQSSISSSSFWDRLLRERYQRLVSLEQERHRERRIITYTHGVPMEITEPVSPSTANGSGCTGMEADEINEAKAEAKPAELFSRRAKSGRSFLFPLGRTNLVDNGFGIDYEEEEEEDRMEDEDADLRLVRRIQRPSRTGVVSGYGGEGTNQRRLADRSWGLASQRKLLGLKDISRTRDSDEDWTPPGAELGEADDDDDDEEWMAEEYPAVPRRFSDQVKLGRTAGMQNRMAKHKKNAMTTYMTYQTQLLQRLTNREALNRLEHASRISNKSDLDIGIAEDSHSLLNSPRPKRLSARPPPGGYTRLLASLGFEASESGDEFGNDRAGIPNQTVTLAAPSNRRRRLPNSRHAPLHCFSDVQHTQLSAERPIKRPRKEPLSRLVCRDEEGCGEKEMEEEEEAETSAKRRLVHALGSGIPSSVSLQPSDMTPAQSVRELARCRKPSWKLSQTIAPSPTRIRRPRGRHCLNGAAGNEGDGNSYSALVASSSRYSSESTPFVQSAELANSIRTSSIKQTGGTRQTTRPALGCLDRLADPFLSQAEKDIEILEISSGDELLASIESQQSPMRAATTTKFTSQMPSDIQVDFSRQQTKSSGVSPLTKTELESGSISIRSFNRMQTSNSTLRAWLELAAVLPECLTLDESGFLIIYGFGPFHRGLFVEAVMRFGLPPPGIIPPQDWLPAELLSLPCEQLFAYTCLFMRHLYEPEALDDTVALWSDGLPKEFVNGASVLSRVAMMAMIRKKVSEFEDFNGLVSYVAEDPAKDTFTFDIREGGLTVLHSVWADEVQAFAKQLSEASKYGYSGLRSAFLLNAGNCTSTSATSGCISNSNLPKDASSRLSISSANQGFNRKRQGQSLGLYSLPFQIEDIVSPDGYSIPFKLLTRLDSLRLVRLSEIPWHSRHDYWLLAGIVVHGYACWNQILSDPRFSLLVKGLEKLPKADHHGFLIFRLRMLEAGLLVEEAVWRMACCAVCPDFLSPEPSPSTHVITSSEADSTTGGSFEISPALSMEQQAHIDRVFKNLASRLQLAGPSKRVTLPHGKKAREAIIKVVQELEVILDDIYADLPMIPATMTYCLSNAAPSQSASKLLLSDQNTSSASLQKHPHNVVLDDSPSTTTDAPIFIDLDLLEPDCSAKTGTSTSPIDFAIRADLSNSGSARSIPEDHVSEQILPNSVLHPVSPVPASPRSSSATGDITSSIPHDLSLTPTLISSLPAATDPPITSADHTSLHESDDHVLTPILTHRSPSFKDLPEEVSRLSPSQTSLISLDSNCFDDSSTTHPKDSVVNASFSFLPSIS